VNVTVAYDSERQVWAVIVNEVEAMTFGGDHARERAEDAAVNLQSLVENVLPWLLHDHDSGGP
jgi:hypothetical protein